MSKNKLFNLLVTLSLIMGALSLPVLASANRPAQTPSAEPVSELTAAEPYLPVQAKSLPAAPAALSTSVAPAVPATLNHIAAVLLSEDFETWPPPGWTIVNNGGDCVWESNTTTGRANNTPGADGDCADADSDACGSGTSMDTELQSPVLDLSTATTATLVFDTDYNAIGEDYAEVLVSDDGGGSWTQEWYYDTDVNGTFQISLDPYVGSNQVIVSFHYVALGWDWWWEVDDVFVTTITEAPDLSNSYKLAPPAVPVGAPFQYTIVISNTGIPFVSPIMTDVIPLGTEYISGSVACSSGTCWYDGVDDAVYWSAVSGSSPGFVRYAHESGTAATLFDIDYPVPHPLLNSIDLGVVNPGWPTSLNNRDGVGYDYTIDTYFAPDYNGDLAIRDDNIIEIDPTGVILNAWETDGADNDSYDGSNIDTVIDIAVVPGSPTRYFATSNADNLLHEIELIKTGTWWMTDTWGTLNACEITGSINIFGVDYDAENGVLYLSDFGNTNIYVTDFDCNLLHSFTCTDGANSYNTGVTYIEGSLEPNGEVWATDFGTVQTRRCDTTGAVLETFADSWAASPLGLVHVPVDAQVSDLITITFDVTCTNPGLVLNEAVIDDPALPAPVVLTATTEQIPMDIEWIKLVNGGEWYPGIEITVQTSDTIEIVEVVSGTQSFVQGEDYYTPTLTLTGYEVSYGDVYTDPISGLVEWFAMDPQGVVTLTKWFHVEPCTWTESILFEFLDPEFGIPEFRVVTITKMLPALWIDSVYNPAVLAGEPADFTLDYGNTGGYENDVWIMNTFPISAPFAGSVPVPTNVAPDGTWAEWNLGDLAMGDSGSIDVTIAVTDTLVPSDTFQVDDWILDHTGAPVDMVSSFFHVVTPCVPVDGLAFTYNPMDPDVGETVYFSATVTQGDPVISYDWAFGDGGTGSGQYVNHAYTLSDTYTVNVTATNCSGAGVDTAMGDVTVVGSCTPPTITDLDSDSPVEIGTAMYFTATVTGDPVISYDWDFGGAGTQGGTDTNPTFTYNLTGTYDVTLVVDNGCAPTDTETIQVQVLDVGACVPPLITGLQSDSPVEIGTAMYFTATATGDPVITYDWDFGGAGAQGGTDTNPTFTYNLTGTYDVALVVDNGCAPTDTETLIVQVTDVGVCAPVDITDVTETINDCVADFDPIYLGDAPITWAWSFPDGTPSSSADENVAGIDFGVSGTYAYTVTATNCSGSGTDTYNDTVTVSCTVADYHIYLPLVLKNH